MQIAPIFPAFKFRGDAIGRRQRCAICGYTDDDCGPPSGKWAARRLCSDCLAVAVGVLDHVVALDPPPHTRTPLSCAAAVLRDMFDGD